MSRARWLHSWRLADPYKTFDRSGQIGSQRVRSSAPALRAVAFRSDAQADTLALRPCFAISLATVATPSIAFGTFVELAFDVAEDLIGSGHG
jgi:hypothetical protein